MNNEVRQKLYELIVQYGRSLCDDPQRCQALLKDYCGKHKREIFVLVSALRNRVAEDLLKSSAGVPQSLLLRRLVRRLEDELGLAEEAAHWAVESWVFALGVLESPPLVESPIISSQASLPAINPQPQADPSPEIIEGFGFVANLADLPPSKPLSTTAPVTKVKPAASSDNKALGFLVFFILHPHFALGLGLVVFIIIIVGYKMVSNSWKTSTKKFTETSVTVPTTDSVRLTTPSSAIILEKAKAGDPNAQFNLGFMYANGQDISKDDIEAVRWYRRAADQGLADAKNNLRFMYTNNRGIPPDAVEMAQWYRQAAEYGYASAQNQLGRLYEEGKGVPKDVTEAVKWYRLAAAQGDVDAQKRLSLVILADRYLDFGDGTIADIQTNLQWMRCSLGQNWNGTTCLNQAKKYAWQVALDTTTAFNSQGGYAGYRNWRVPTKAELITLIYCSISQPNTWNDIGKSCKGNNPTIFQPVFPNMPTPTPWFWTSTTDVKDFRFAWDISFFDGKVDTNIKTTESAVRLVRNRP